MTTPESNRDLLVGLVADLSRPFHYGYLRPFHQRFRLEAPYTFTTLANGWILPLNRVYKPLGMAAKTWVDYEDFADQAIPASWLNLAAAPIQSSNCGPGHCEAYLYKDGTGAWVGLEAKLNYRQALRDVLSPVISQH